jgi:hypothetical protein
LQSLVLSSTPGTSTAAVFTGFVGVGRPAGADSGFASLQIFSYDGSSDNFGSSSGSEGSSDGSGYCSGSGSGSVHADVVRARHEARRAEDLTKRAAELEQARR